jgi:hypothetical protein
MYSTQFEIMVTRNLMEVECEHWREITKNKSSLIPRFDVMRRYDVKDKFETRQRYLRTFNGKIVWKFGESIEFFFSRDVYSISHEFICFVVEGF